MTTGANASNSFTTTQLAAANTGLSAPYLRANEREVLQLINLARADGNLFLKQYGDRYIAATPAFQHNRYAQSLYTDLRRIKGLPPLQPSFKLAKSATAHAQDIGTHGLQSHTSSNGCKYDQRISRFIGSPYVALGENISYGKDHNQALPIVMNLLIDNNNEALGHRRNILSPTFESIGIAIQAHQKHGFTCVQDYAAGIE